MTKQLASAQELARMRANIYWFLAMVYARPPGLDFLRFLAGWVASLIEPEVPPQLLSEQMRHSLGMLGSFFKKRRGNSGEELGEAVSVEFTRLFRGVTPHYSPLPPYESLYREESRRVFNELTTTVHREYSRFGFDLAADILSGEPPDHISFELDFMHLLCRQEAEAWERDNENEALRFLLAEQAFLREHLMTWLPKFSSEIGKCDRLGLFRHLADLTEGWVSFDYHQHLNTKNSQMETSNDIAGAIGDEDKCPN